MSLSRRAFLASCLGAAVHPGGMAASPRSTGRLALGRPGLQAAVQPGSAEFPWATLRQELASRFSDLRRHFVFEYYAWYANQPFRHWQQWGRQPPVDIAASSMPWLGAYDSRSAAVIEQHARWIAESGVGVVNISWWGRGSFSDRAVPLVMDVMHAHDIQVTFHLEPYSPRRVTQLADDVAYLLRTFGERRRWDCFFLHERADGSRGPVFKLFNATLPEQVEDCHGELQRVPGYAADSTWRRATDNVRTRLRADFPSVTLLNDTWDGRRTAAAGFDGIATYDPAVPMDDWLDHALVASQQGLVFSFNVNAGMDEIDRRKLPAGSCLQPRPFIPSAPDLDWSRETDRERAHELSDRQIQETLEWSLLLQTHPWLSDVGAGFFLTYITSFNEWHEGTQFEPMKDHERLTGAERAVGYHNPTNGGYRLARLATLLRRLTS